MVTIGLDHEMMNKTTKAIERIVQAAAQAPSGDNCQPWRFVWDGKTLTIGHDEERARHGFNRVNHASCLSLGCVLESIHIAASGEKLRVHI